MLRGPTQYLLLDAQLSCHVFFPISPLSFSLLAPPDAHVVSSGLSASPQRALHFFGLESRSGPFVFTCRFPSLPLNCSGSVSGSLTSDTYGPGSFSRRRHHAPVCVCPPSPSAITPECRRSSRLAVCLFSLPQSPRSGFGPPPRISAAIPP